MANNINNFFTRDDDYVDIFGNNDDVKKALSGKDDINYTHAENIEPDNKYYDEDNEYDDNGYEEYIENHTPLWLKCFIITLYAIIIIFAFMGILCLCLPQVRVELLGAFF